MARPPLTPRYTPRPAEYAYSPEDETPTRPDGLTDAHLAVIVSVYRQECELDRKRLARLVEAWHSLTLDQRVLIESLAFEMARPR